MTWTLAGTTTNTLTSYQDLWEEIFMTYLNTREGWSCAPTGSGYAHFVNYTFQNTYTNEQHTCYGLWNGASYFYRNNKTYTSTPGDSTTGGQYLTIPTSGVNAGEVWRVWYSTENDRAMLVTYGKTPRFYAQGPSEVWLLSKGQSNWAAGTQEDAGCFAPSFGDSPYYWGPPVYSSSSTSNSYAGRIVPSWTFSNATYTDSPMLIKQVVYTCGGSSNVAGSTSIPLFKIEQNDTFIELPNLDDGTSDVFGYATGSGALIKSGVNYYYRLRADLSDRSLLFDFGTTEPDFSLTS